MFHEGHQIGPYTLIRRLGRGGFGDVWLAERKSKFLTKKVAVKLPHDDQVDFDTIQREAGLWEEASGHPNVLPIIDAEVYDGQVVIVSEFADGGSLDDKLKDVGTTSIKEAVDLTMGVLNGLEFLHSRRIIHRDIKPQNILLQGNTPRLADFGISRAMATSAVSSTIIGTDAYMSPEAFDGKRTVQTDIWSTGVVLYQLLNGSLPFPQTHPTERMFAVLTKDFEPLADDIPNDLRMIVTTALAKLPENRFASAGAMREALGHAKVRIDHPTLAHTEVYDRSSIPLPAQPFSDPQDQTDPEATVIRVQIPTEQETIVRPAAPQAPASTQLAFDSHLEKPAAPYAPARPSTFVGPDKPPIEKLKGWFNENPLMGIIGVGSLIIGGFFLLLAFAALFPSRTSNTPRLTNSAINMNKAANAMNTAANTMSNAAANAMKPINNSNSNYSPSTNSTASKSPFCSGYSYSWKEAYKAETGSYPPYEPICPNENNYKDTTYEGGKTTGYYQGMTYARSLKSSNSNK